MAQCTDDGEPESPGPDDDDVVPGSDMRIKRGMYGTGGGFDHYGVFVGEVVGDGVQLHRVGHEA